MARNLLKNFTLKNCLFVSTNIVKGNDKEKYVHSNYGIAFDLKDDWSFDNGLSFHYNSDNSYLFVNGKEIYKFKASNKREDFLPQFCQGSISNKLDYVHSEEVSLKGNVYPFSVDYSSVHKSDILNICKYLMTMNDIKTVQPNFFIEF